MSIIKERYRCQLWRIDRCERLMHFLSPQLMQGTGLSYLTGSGGSRTLLPVKEHTLSFRGYRNLSSSIAAPVHVMCLSSLAAKVKVIPFDMILESIWLYFFHVWLFLFSPTTDLQNVNITLRILFRPVTTQLPRIFTSIGEDYDERVLPSITTEVLKSVVVSMVLPPICFLYIVIVTSFSIKCSLCDLFVYFCILYRLVSMPASSSPKENLCLGRSVRTSQKEPQPLASSWTTCHWYEAVVQVAHLVCVVFSVPLKTWSTDLIFFSFRHIWPLAKSLQRLLKWSRWLSRKLSGLGLS